MPRLCPSLAARSLAALLPRRLKCLARRRRHRRLPGQVSVIRDPDAFHEPAPADPAAAAAQAAACYRISRPVLPDAGLSAAVLAALQAALPETGAAAGLNATADSFYGYREGDMAAPPRGTFVC